ncbi:unnamed protein product [Sphagnum jensenii]|uniref:Uncharacterized protein n=1 Tax=Sphagnum jensenii TaxID=128206 RepID=A0ABP0VS72_9BRYO
MGSVQSSSCETSSVQSNSCQGSSPSSVPERGRHNVDPYLKELGADGVVITVLEIGHYRQPFQPRGRGMELLHDFVGLRVRVGGREKLIKAEKFTEKLIEAEKFTGKIDISKVESSETNGAEIKHGPVGVEDCGEIGMGDLLAILKEHCPDYSVISDNCWKYADSTFRRLIRNFSAHPTISPERRSELEGFLNHPAPTMPDNVIFSCVSASLGGAGTEAGLAFLASIGSSVILFHTVPTMQVAAPALLQFLSAPHTMQAFAAAQAQAQTMLPALSPHLSHAAVVTGSKISPVVAAIPVNVGKAVAVTVSRFFWPLAIAFGVAAALVILSQLVRLLLEATPRGQRWLRKLRAFFSRRRTGPSTT